MISLPSANANLSSNQDAFNVSVDASITELDADVDLEVNAPSMTTTTIPSTPIPSMPTISTSPTSPIMSTSPYTPTTPSTPTMQITAATSKATSLSWSPLSILSAMLLTWSAWTTTTTPKIPKTPTKKKISLSWLSEYQGFWYPLTTIKNVISVQAHFQANDKDIIIATFPKSGTTWLKAIIFSIVNRDRYTLSTTPLLSANPHQLITFLESKRMYAQEAGDDVSTIKFPSLFSTHIPYTSLPESIKSSDCKIIYICRNPLDVIVSYWHYSTKGELHDTSKRNLSAMVESFCKGESGYGPFWEHMLEYWKQSLERPEKFMFLKYEDLKEDTTLHIKNIANFIGFPFSAEEEGKGVIKDIAHLCSLSNLKDLDVNKTGTFPKMEYKHFFRKGEVGDWVNHLTPSMVENINSIMEEKFSDSGLTFKVTG